jgi:hypothetical protein
VGTRHQLFSESGKPPHFVEEVNDVFHRNEAELSVRSLGKSFTQNQVLSVVKDDLTRLGFHVRSETKPKGGLRSALPFGVEMPSADDPDYPIYRALSPHSPYTYDAEHPTWRCRLEVLPNRAGRGTQLFWDLIAFCNTKKFDWLFLAVPNEYQYRSGGPIVGSDDFPSACRVAKGFYTERDSDLPVRRPVGVVVIGYGSIFA